MKIAEEVKSKELTPVKGTAPPAAMVPERTTASSTSNGVVDKQLSSSSSSAASSVGRGLSVYHNLIRQQMQPERGPPSSKPASDRPPSRDALSDRPRSAGCSRPGNDAETSRATDRGHAASSSRPGLEKFRNQLNAQIKDKNVEKDSPRKPHATDHVEVLIPLY